MSEKRGIVSRADLVKTLANPDVAQWLADRLCLVDTPDQAATNPLSTTAISELLETSDVSIIESLEEAAAPLTAISQRPKTHFWYLTDRDCDLQNKQQTDQTDTAALQAEEAIDQDWHHRPTEPPRHIPLLEGNALLARLRPFLKQDTAGRGVDLDKVIKTISRAEHLTSIPRKSKKHQQWHLHIIDDRSRHLTPYWKDHDLAKLALLQEAQGKNISFSVLAEGESQPLQLTAQGLDDWQCPPQSLVLVLSDLGVLQRYTTRRTNIWKHLGQQLQQKQCKTMALLPCSRQWVSWQDSSFNSSPENEKKLLSHLAPCIRIEPGLVRQMRLALALPTELESLIWQNPAITTPHSVAASWDDSSRHAYLQSFASLTEAERTSSLSIIRGWRQPLDKQVWYEEITTLDEASQQLPLIDEDIVQAQSYFTALSEQFQNESLLAEKQHTQAWCRRLFKRLPEHCLNQSPSLQKIALKVHKENPDYNPRGINPQNLPDSSEPETQGALYQRGNALRLKLYEPFVMPETGYSRLALIKLRHAFVQVMQGGKILGSLKLNDETEIRLLKNDPITVRSDLETLSLNTLTAPDNVNLGRDVCGLFADIEFYEVNQRFRYIEPTTFMMGSPEGEKGRTTFEDYHQVTLSQGYWIADTACTQRLWQAVMGDNPAEFKANPQNPVEKVSWLDVQAFMLKLKAQVPDLNIQLPSEAQWENACRAGTTTPFSFDGDIDLDKVNYRGLWASEQDVHGNYPWHESAKRKTQVVKRYPVNPWGLYEMHGNVLEWCFDEWKENLGQDSAVNPVNAIFKSGVKPDKAGSRIENASVYDSAMLENGDDDSVDRVLRGGSWYLSGGRLCRSAFRAGSPADVRFNDVGFRFSLGLELPHSAASRSDKASPSEQTEADTARRGAAQGLSQAGRGILSTDINEIKDVKEMNEFMSSIRPAGGWSPDDIKEPLAERVTKGIKKLFGRKDET